MYVNLDDRGNETKPVDVKGKIERIRDVVCEWIDHFATQINPPLPSPLWDEKSEQDYFTVRPRLDAYAALLMLQACRLLKKRFPKYVNTMGKCMMKIFVKKQDSMNPPIRWSLT